MQNIVQRIISLNQAIIDIQNVNNVNMKIKLQKTEKMDF